tara:strand:- start:25 stop:336 length:312 start_codon:yes stop_codon:yes gene_type:complete
MRHTPARHSAVKPVLPTLCGTHEPPSSDAFFLPTVRVGVRVRVRARVRVRVRVRVRSWLVVRVRVPADDRILLVVANLLRGREHLECRPAHLARVRVRVKGEW